MKKLLFSIALFSILLIAACTSGAAYEALVFNLDDWEDSIVDIGEDFFATQIMDILNSSGEYLDRIIRYEGILWRVYWSPTGHYHYYVIRFTEGCCGGYYSSIGFELYFDGVMPIPDGAWVEVAGFFEPATESSIQHVRLRVVSIVELEERGTEFVSN